MKLRLNFLYQNNLLISSLMIFFGALSNISEKVFYGKVFDYLNLGSLNFNVADVIIFLGIILYVKNLFIHYKKFGS